MATESPQKQLIDKFKVYRKDPYGFVLFSYPWGKKGTWLEKYDGPDYWQAEIMETLREELEKRDDSPEEAFASIQIAVASGHGIGKTSLIAWLIHWFVCCYPNPQVKVTAGTFAQLSGKTWRELSKWHKVSIQEPWFTWTATRFYLKEDPSTWFAEAIPWTEHNSDAFAGTHEKYVMYLFDEASAIADIIWEVSEGAMTTFLCIWIAFGNPVRNTGRFKACFGKFRKWWICRQIDSRTAKMANKADIARKIEQYGEDSDYVRKRIKGQFPRMSSNQLVSEETADFCRLFDATGYESFPIRIGVDIAGEGEESDDTVFTVVQGNKVHEVICFSQKDPIQVYTKIVELYDYWKKKNNRIMVFIDAIGIGYGVYAMVRNASIPVIGVISGAAARDPKRFINIRIEMWYAMAQALKEGIDLTAVTNDDWVRLKDDLINIEYFEAPQNQKYQLESVKDLKERELPSPDYGTSLALTFAYPVPHAVQSQGNKFSKANSGQTTIQKKKGVHYGRSKKTFRGQ